MDNSKDIQKTDGAIKFLDYQTLKSSPFGENKVGERLYRRAERLASAVILLTNTVHEDDPLRREARKSALDILAKILAVRDEMRSQNSSKVNDLKIEARRMISVLRLLGIAGNISFQNVEIMTEAFDELMTFISASRRSNMSDSVSISREDVIDVRDFGRQYDDRRSERVSSDPVAENKAPQLTGTQAPQVEAGASTSTRGRAILETLRMGGEMGIREVAANLPEYSEKMIQRELAELVSQGRVKKSGHKRWSKYTFI